MLKTKNLIISNIIIGLLLLFFIAKYIQLSQHNAYHRNRMIESEYINDLLNDSKGDKLYFEKKWGKKLLSHDDVYDYLITSEMVFKDALFKKENYIQGVTSMIGYSLKFNESGRLVEINLVEH